MLTHLHERFERLERARAELCERLSAFSPGQLQFRPAPQAWSCAEIVHHLVLSESFAVAYLGKKLDRFPTLQTVSWSAGLRSTVLSWALRSPLKFNAPSPHVLPKPDIALHDLRAPWDELRRKLHALLERVTPEMLRLPLYRHPVAGLLTVAQMLIFMYEHFDHHEQQIKGIIKRANFSQKDPEVVA